MKVRICFGVFASQSEMRNALAFVLALLLRCFSQTQDMYMLTSIVKKILQSILLKQVDDKGEQT